jgi:single-strand DNA-binding protein
MSLNQVNLIGNVGHSPKITAAKSGMIVAKFSIATSERVKRDGEWGEHTEWHDLVAFGKTAEIVERYVGHGQQISIVGKLRTSKWDDKDTGKKMRRTEIIVDRLILLKDRKKDSDHDQGESAASKSWANQDPATEKKTSSGSGFKDDEDDLPF